MVPIPAEEKILEDERRPAVWFIRLFLPRRGDLFNTAEEEKIRMVTWTMLRPLAVECHC
jgi:hypothetical protein